MNSDEPNTPKSYNVDNDLSRGKEDLNSANKNINETDLSTPNVDEPISEKESEVINDITRYLAIGEQSIFLLKDLGALATLELTISLEAIKDKIFLQLLLLPVISLLYISVALSITYIVHIEFQSIYLTVTVLLLSQIMGITIIKHKIKKSKKHIGFQKTLEQIYEVKSELLKSIKKTN